MMDNSQETLQGLKNDLKFIETLEKGETLSRISKITHPSWFSLAVEHGRTEFIRQFLNAHDVPHFGTLKERVAYYQLMGSIKNCD